MGNVLSSATTGEGDAITSESVLADNISATPQMENNEDNIREQQEDEAHAKSREEDMNEFRKQLNIKREQRREILARHRAEKDELEKSLQNERFANIELSESNKKLRELLTVNNIPIPGDNQSTRENYELCEAVAHITEEFEKLKGLNNKFRLDLVDSNTALQNAYSDISELHSQNRESIKQISALKEVVTVSKTMINLREDQLSALKNKLNEIERTLADRETNLLSADLRHEYEKQLQNIRTLRGLYEERARLAEVTRQGLLREIDEQKRLYQAEVTKNQNLSSQIEALESKVETLQDTIENKNNQISTSQDETTGLRAEMEVVHKLFSQVLLGYKTKQDLDKLVHRLKENHGILTHMAEKENGSEISSALPKLLLELVSQVDENDDEKHCNDKTEEIETIEFSDVLTAKNTTPEEIVENLPKVWKVLTELLSHQSFPEVDSSEKVTTCYKSVDTKSGPVLVPSVSQTYIRLKDLIVEKLGLIKEVNRMKQLNTHLETRLEVQERRLCLVTTELSKTWHVVSRLRRHHHQLHTHEKILKYELQQKRKLLNELKEELEYCREKCDQAREKNIQSEKDWKKLRAEFSSRKAGSPSLNNSAESGYSDERPSDDSSESNDESEYTAEPMVRCKKKLKKSFENILDSSADFNLRAERDDPASDMIDVAELPLDTHDDDGNQNISDDLPNNFTELQDNKISDETEDELCNITHDESLTEESPLVNEDCDNIQENNLEEGGSKESTRTVDQTVPNSTPTTNDDMASLENSSTENTIKLNEQHHEEITVDACDTKDDTINVQLYTNNPNENMNDGVNTEDHIKSVEPAETAENKEVKINDAPESIVVDFKAILENVRLQNERLAKKDERLQNLEDKCSEVVKKLSNTLNTGTEIAEKLESIHANHGNDDNTEDKPCSSNNELETNTSVPEPSTSSEIDHEARFAARDLRLKRLEEQTKCLVNKVNKTTSKGVKINYKLEELHNIYGSESSRAGTPSEENDDKNTENDNCDSE